MRYRQCASEISPVEPSLLALCDKVFGKTYLLLSTFVSSVYVVPVPYCVVESVSLAHEFFLSLFGHCAYRDVLSLNCFLGICTPYYRVEVFYGVVVVAEFCCCFGSVEICF